MKLSPEIEKLQSNLVILHKELRQKMSKEWNRIQPFEEMLFDRWEKARFLKAKKGASIYHNNYIGGDVSIGEKTWVGPLTVLDGTGDKLKIGKFCSISSGVQVYTHHTVEWSLTGGKSSKKTGKTTIGDNCYLGGYSIIGMGIKIGKCSVIGAFSFVNSDIPPYSIAYGIPAKVVGKVKIKNGRVSFDYFKDSMKNKNSD